MSNKNNRIYDRMLGRNTNRRAKAARKERVDALEALRHQSTDAPTYLFYKVCVTDWEAHLKAEAATSEHSERTLNEKIAREEEADFLRKMNGLEKLVRFLIRGSKWKSQVKVPFGLELRSAALRYSAIPVHVSMILAV